MGKIILPRIELCAVKKVSSALHWLIKHNPVYKDVKIDYCCLAALPFKGIPNDLPNINCCDDNELLTARIIALLDFISAVHIYMIHFIYHFIMR